ncbi:MAG: hypothetical protein IKU34_04810 [Clostridia bacterium]|nr:hypothetical protein [Clostridia bacterium]
MFSPSGESPLLAGSVNALTLRLSVPGLTAMLASSLGVLLDAFFLSRCGADAAAAAAFCFPLVTLLQTIGFTLGMGAGSLLSRAIGHGQSAAQDRAHSAAAAALYGAFALACLCCALGQLFPAPLLRLLGAREALLVPAVAYARWVLIGGVLMCPALVLGSLLRGQGYTLPGMAAHGAGTLLGGALSFLFVSRLSLGITGAGAAMLAREALILLILSVCTLRIPGALRPKPGDIRLQRRILTDIMRSGTPTLVRQGLMSVSSVLLSRSCALLGTAAVAGMGAAQRVLGLVSACIIGFLQGFSPVCGAAYGAGQAQRVKESYVFCRRVLLLSLLAAGVVVFFAAPSLMSRIAPDAQSARFGALVLRAQSAVLCAQGAVLLMNALTQSMGLPVRASLIASGRQGYLLIPLLMVLPRFFGIAGIIIAQPVSDLLSLFIGWALVSGFTGFSFSPCGCCDARKASQ